MTRAAKREVAVRWAFAYRYNEWSPATSVLWERKKDAEQDRRDLIRDGNCVSEVVRLEIPLPRRGKAKP